MNEQKFNEILSDKQFVSRLMELDNPKEMQEALGEKGLDLSESEIGIFLNDMKAVPVDGQEELSEDELEHVAGGISSAMKEMLTQVYRKQYETLMSKFGQTPTEEGFAAFLKMKM